MTPADGELPLAGRALLALTAVLVLVWAVRWAMLRHGLTPAAATPAVGGLALVASLSLDPRHRLVIVRYRAGELLLALGPAGVTRLDGPPGPDASSPPPAQGAP